MTSVREITVPAADWADLETLTTAAGGVITTGTEVWLQNLSSQDFVVYQTQAAKPNVSNMQGWRLNPFGKPDNSQAIPAGKPKVWIRANGTKPAKVNVQSGA